LKLNGTHQLLVYTYDAKMPGESMHTIQENAEALVVAGRKIGIEGNADKSTWSCLKIRMQGKVTV
jgi:hypothetical protein